MVKTTDLVAAMRCSSQAPTPSPPCTTCAYRVVELLDGKEYTGCDCDRMGMDAADKIEELVDRCARYAEEIAVLREKMKPYEDTGLTPEEIDMDVVYTTLSDQIIFEQADIGKTVFLTREEARKALGAMRKGEVT